jgi:hypothetical protein
LTLLAFTNGHRGGLDFAIDPIAQPIVSKQPLQTRERGARLA